MSHTLSPSRPASRISVILAVSAMALGLSACGKREDATVGQRSDAPVERTQPTAPDSRANADSTVQGAGSNGATGVGDAARNTAQSAMDKVDDATITAQVSASLARDPDLSALRIDVDTRDGVVTLKGPASTAAAKERAETIARGVKGVTSVSNQLQVAAS